MILARIAANAADFAAIFDQDEQRREPLDRDEGKIGRQCSRDIDAAQRGERKKFTRALLLDNFIPLGKRGRQSGI